MIFQTLLLALILCIASVWADQALQFSLPPRSQQCFYEDVKKGHKRVFEMLILTGPDYSATLDIYEDLTLEMIKQKDLGTAVRSEFISLDTTDADSFITTLEPTLHDTTYALCIHHSDLFVAKDIRLNIFQAPTKGNTKGSNDSESDIGVPSLERTKQEDEKGLNARADRIVRRLEKVENQLARDKARLTMHSTSESIHIVL